MSEDHEGLRPGLRLSRYDLVEPLARGGMGEVWRARDTRLQRDVALKVLRSDAYEGPEALRAIEREARAASALSHPHLVTLHEVDTDSRPPFLVMELVEGQTLAALVEGGPLPAARALSLAAQVADGLAAAHEAGLVHRDLKPANVVVTKGGAAKVLDFGLARRAGPRTAGPSEATLPRSTSSPAGTVVGTAGYMSPEQVAGRPADFRSDQFALGVVLYELLSGRRAFEGATVVEKLAAILKDEPPPLPPLPATFDAPLRWLLGRCLAKEPEGRYAATRDLAKDLDELARVAAVRPGTDAVPALPAPRGRRWLLPAVLAGLVALTAASALVLFRNRAPDLPTFNQLTYRRGAVHAARFTPGGEGIVYGAAWNGEPIRPFSVRVEGGDSSLLGDRDANVLAVSPGGEAALSLDATPVLPGMTAGTLARLPLSGGTPRALVEGVSFADFAPDGSLVTVRGRTLEGPGGKVLHESSGWISNPRVSRDGRLVAFVDHQRVPDDRGNVAVVPLAGGDPRVLSGPQWTAILGLAWSRDGREVWFTATAERGDRALHAVTLSRAHRTILRMPGKLTLHDISATGRVLLAHDHFRIEVVRGGPRQAERDEAWLGNTFLNDASADLRKLLFTELGEGGGRRYTCCVRLAGKAAPVPLGDGIGSALSPDGERVLVVVPTDRADAPNDLTILTTGPGAPVHVRTAPVNVVEGASWFPDGRSILVVGSEPGKGSRLWRLDGPNGPARPLSDEGADSDFCGGLVSPDGRNAVVAHTDGGLLLAPAEPGPERRLARETPRLSPVRWVDDGRAVLAFARRDTRAELLRVDAATGAATPLHTIRPLDPAGVLGISTVRTTADGSEWVYSYGRLLSELYLVDGLR